MNQKLKDLYLNGRQLGLRKPIIQWEMIKDFTVMKFMWSGSTIYGLGRGSYKSACNVICRDGHFDRRYLKRGGRRNYDDAS
tara:strand:- start:1449 stop:1691 length:243 start_codon:yes stop_codon:yes gene_type:complete